MSHRLLAMLCVLLPACTTTTDELRGVAELPRINRAVLLTGGAFFAESNGPRGTFLPLVGEDEGDRDAVAADRDAAAPAAAEAIPFPAIRDVLQRGRVFQRVVADDDDDRRRRVRAMLDAQVAGVEAEAFLRGLRADGFDLLMVVEELRDGPIETQGTNGRWPVTFVTWILLGVGALIPDRTFESRASLRVSLRELQSGRVVHDLLLVPGPVELALTERTDVVGLLMSILVPPFGSVTTSVSSPGRFATPRNGVCCCRWHAN